MKKLITLLTILSFLFYIPVLAACNSYSASLNGSNQIFTAADSTSLSITGDFTLEAWIKPSSLTWTDSEAGIVGKGDSANNGQDYDMHAYKSGATNRLYCFYYDGSAALTLGYATVSGGWTTTDWWHTACSVDVSAATMDFFINGTKTAGTMVVQNATSVRNSNGVLTIGSENWFTPNTRFFPGLIDEVRVSNYIRYTANFSVQTTEYSSDANTTGLWHLDNALTDDSGNSNTLTNVNSATFSTTVPFGTCSVPAIKIPDLIWFW